MSAHQETRALINLATVHRNHEAAMRHAFTAGDEAAAQHHMHEARHALANLSGSNATTPEARVLAMIAKITGLRINLSNNDYTDTWENWDGREEPYELAADLSADLIDLARMLGIEEAAARLQAQPVP